MPYLDVAKFGSVALLLMFELRVDLISFLVERWHPETHTFHLTCGECTITLEYVALQLRLSIDGYVVMSSSKVFESAMVCYHLFGRSSDDGEARLMSLKFSWLKENFETLSSSAIEWEKMCVARAYIL
ncbi:hypothetical protein PVK06_001545 [Gossypium arboreum]|uniref:Aminotransferase-like plant mobile domain-containing protein n=1 Tax=Gossypium arboreum TaxID=29729 RepID=A0ABR0R2I6_GOSAR|nr:hypothetical protein PVK06_001545 [Gossypium arboreum]